MFNFIIVAAMRWQAVIVLAAIVLGLVIPPSFAMTGGDRTVIGSLDVCHAAAPALSSSGEMPCMSECPCNPSPLAMNEVFQPAEPSLKPYFMPFQEELPPKA